MIKWVNFKSVMLSERRLYSIWLYDYYMEKEGFIYRANNRLDRISEFEDRSVMLHEEGRGEKKKE